MWQLGTSQEVISEVLKWCTMTHSMKDKLQGKAAPLQHGKSWRGTGKGLGKRNVEYEQWQLHGRFYNWNESNN